jgi:hypothetical protein
MPRRRSTNFNNQSLFDFRLERVVLAGVLCYFFYELMEKVYLCRSEESDFRDKAYQVLNGPACGELKYAHTAYLNCDSIAKDMSKTAADLRWWSCMFSSISILQSTTTWVVVAVLFYIFSLWMRYTYQTQPHQPQNSPQILVLQQPREIGQPPRRRQQNREEQLLLVESDSDEEVIVEFND